MDDVVAEIVAADVFGRVWLLNGDEWKEGCWFVWTAHLVLWLACFADVVEEAVVAVECGDWWLTGLFAVVVNVTDFR